jgi:geranylgeranyl reductase family protein
VKRYDCVVVGAGPSGSTTAYRLAREGASVLLLDRAGFPRDKPCGGGVTGRAARMLPFSIDPVVEEVVTVAELGLGYKRRVERGSGQPLAYMTQRKKLDAHLVEHAVAVGAEFRDGVKATVLEAEEERVVVQVNGDRIAARALVGADGANGVTARALALGGNKEVGVALEGNLSYERLDRERYRGRLIIDFATVRGGYAWVFPKGDHVNFGVGGYGSEGPRLREQLEGLCAAHGVRVDDLESVRGFRLPLRLPTSRLARGPGLLVGDAAGLIDPVSGDGMYECFLSGKLASEAVVAVLEGRERSLDPYSARLTRQLAPLLWASWSIKAALDRFPRTAFALAQTHLVWNVVEKMLAGEMADVRLTRGLARPLLKALALLARAAGDPGRAFRPAR